jgi:hypothetical protein
VQHHKFFKNEQWDFNTIRDCVPPIVCELSGDDDTRNFDDVENEAPNEDFPTPKAFAGNHLPFVGFTYCKDYQLLSGSSEMPKPPPPIPGRVGFYFHLKIGIIRQISRECCGRDIPFLVEFPYFFFWGGGIFHIFWHFLQKNILIFLLPIF